MLLLLIVYLIFSCVVYMLIHVLFVFLLCFLFLQMSKLYLVENMFTIYFVGKSMLEDDS
jgi:hypothetical protein